MCCTIFPASMFFFTRIHEWTWGARSSISLVVSDVNALRFFYHKKYLSKSTSTRTQGRKDPTQRRGQRDSHRSSYWTRAATFSLRKIAVTNLPVNSPFFFPTILHNLPRFVQRLNFKVNRRSRVSETPISRIVELHFLMEKISFYGYVTFVLV